jgi:hypothetical protein
MWKNYFLAVQSGLRESNRREGIQMRKAIILLALASSNVMASVDNQGFYATREGQIFKSQDARELEHGYVQGDDTPYFTWKGFISGKQLYFEVHGEQIKVVLEKRQTVLPFASAPSMPGADASGRALDDKGPDLFVKSSKDPRQSLICIESLGPDIYIRPRPYKEVYLVTDPVGKPGIYRLSGINSSCRGIERTSDGNLLTPNWKVDKSKSPNVLINYYRVGNGHLTKSDIQITGTIASGDAQEYNIDESR